MRPQRIWLLLPPLLALGAQGQFRQLYISGKVVMPDGAPPPQPAKLELRCEGMTQPQAFTDSKGSFNFPVGGAKHRRIEDASRTGPMAPVGASGPDRSFVSLTNCELEASLPGYTSSKINLGRRSVFESPDVGTLILRPVAKGAGLLVSMTTLSAPEEARKAFERAEKETNKEKPNLDKAARELEKAVQSYSQFAAAWNLLGENRARRNDLPGAEDAFRKSAESDPKFLPPMLSLALLELKQNRMPEAAQWAERILKLAPEHVEASYYNAIALSTLGNLEAAEASIKVVHASPDAARYPRTRFLLGNVYAQRGQVQEAAAEFRQFLAAETAGPAAEAVRKQLAEWEAAGLIKPL